MRALNLGISSEIAISFNVATSLFAVPLYVPLYASPGFIDLARLFLLVQILPTLALFAVGRGLGWSGRWDFARRAYWIALTLAGVASFLRSWQLHLGFGFPDAPAWMKLAAVASVGPAILALTFIRADWIPKMMGRLIPITITVSVAFLAFIQLSTPTAAGVKTTNVMRDDAAFVFIFDELGRDALGGRRTALGDGPTVDEVFFPNFAAFAADSTWIADATSNFSPSCESIPSMLSGRPQPRCDESFLVGGKARLLTTLAQNFSLEVYGEYLEGCPDHAEVCRDKPYLITHYPLVGIVSHLFPQSFRAGPALDAIRIRDGFPYTLALWTDFLDQVRTVDLHGRAFFVHLNLPHSPYAYLADGRLSHTPPRSQYFYGTEQDTVAYDNYREQIRFVDALFGNFIGILQQRGAYATATIVVTGDHGPRLQVPPRTTTLVGISAETPDVPVIVRSPRIGKVRDTSEYQHIDFTRTVLDAVGLAAEEFQGRSALEPGALPRQKWFVYFDTVFIRESDGSWRKLEEQPTWPDRARLR